MSVASKNPFDLLGDDGDDSPSPAVTKPAAAAPKAAAAAPVQPARTVPGSAPRGGTGTRGRGSYPARGGRASNGPGNDAQRNTGPTSSEGVTEGNETPGGFDGERVPPPRRAHRGPDAHTKGPRGNRPIHNRTSGGHTSRGGDNIGRPRVPVGGGERRQFERRSGTNPDSQRKVDQGWGADEGEAELNAEQQGEKDAQAEENQPQTPAAEGDDGGWGAADDEATVKPAGDADTTAAAPEEPEEVTKSYEQYLAEKAEAALQFGKKEGARQVTGDSLEGTQFRREAINEFFAPKEKVVSQKEAKAKKEKIYIEVDGQFASPAGSERRGGGRGGPRGGSSRGGAGGQRGFGRGGGDRDRAPSGRGRGGPRGSGRGGRGGAAGAVDANDERAFPALGA